MLLAAGDTFRAAATEQLEEWARRAEVDIVKGKAGGEGHTVGDASPEARACRPRPQDTVARIRYEAQAEEGEIEGEVFAFPEDAPAELVVHRLSRANPSAWMRDYDAALVQFGGSDEQVGRQWAKSA